MAVASGEETAVAGPRRPRLATHLVVLVLAVLLPALVIGAVAAWDALRRQEAATEARMLDTARALATALDGKITGAVTTLRVLAASADLDPGGDLTRFRDLAEAAGRALGAWVSVTERDGTQVLNTQRPAGDPLPGPGGAIGPAGGGAWIRRAFETGEPVVTDVATGRVSGRAIAVVFVPVLRGGEVRRVLGTALLPERLAETLAGQAAAGAGAVALTDGRGVLVARSRDGERLAGRTRPQRDDGPAGESGVLNGTSMVDGSAIRTAYHRLSAAPGWHVWVNEPEASFAAARRASVLALAGGAALALALGLLVAAVLSRRLLRPVEAIVAHAEAVASGEVAEDAPAAPPARVAEFERLRRAVAGAEAALRRVQRIGRVGGFEIDLRSGVNRRSGEYMRVQGRGARAALERHEDWVRRLHPDDRVRAERHFLAATADDAADTAYAQEYRIVTPAGEVRWIYALAEIERAPDGRALRMVGAHVDVTALKDAEAALRDSEERLRLALEAARLGAWEIDYRTGLATRTQRALDIFGFAGGADVAPHADWRDRVHPKDRSRVAEAIGAVRTGRSDGYRIEYRFQRPDGRWIWVESHGRAAGLDPGTGRPARLIGTSQDITERREAEDRQAVLVHELDHRAKNTLAVVQATLRLTPREDAGAFSRAVEGRVNALARAHTLLANARWQGAGLREVAEDALAPFLGANGPAAEFRGPPVSLSTGAVQALSMAFHELATNAAKHGALSVAAGRVLLGWVREGDALTLSWSEEGGPPVTGAPASRGFGSSLVTATVARQLGGRMEVTWRPAGLLWVARLPMARLVPGGGEAGGEPGGAAAEPVVEALAAGSA